MFEKTFLPLTDFEKAACRKYKRQRIFNTIETAFIWIAGISVFMLIIYFTLLQR